MSDRMPCGITDSWIQEPDDVLTPTYYDEDGDMELQRELDDRDFSEDQKAEALDEVYEGEWRERFPDPAIAFDVLGSDKLRRAASLIAARDLREAANRELREALESIARMSEIPLLKRQAG